MENRAHALAAGLFTLLLLAALVAVAVWFRQDTAVRDRYLLVASSSVSGLSAQAAVRLRGVDVGKVENIRFDPTDPATILITALIDREAPLSRGTRGQLAYQGVTGIASIELSDDGADPTRLVPDPANPPRIPVDPSVIEQMMARGPALIDTVDQVARQVSRLLSDENQSLVTASLSSVQKAGEQVGALAERTGALAAQSAAKIDRLVDHADAVLAQVTPALKATEGAVKDAGAAIRRVEGMVGNVDALTLKLGERLDSIGRITRSVEQLGDVSRAFGEAVVGNALPRISDLIDEMSRSVRSLDRVLSDFQEQPQSLVFGRGPGQAGPGEPGFVPPATDGP